MRQQTNKELSELCSTAHAVKERLVILEGQPKAAMDVVSQLHGREITLKEANYDITAVNDDFPAVILKSRKGISGIRLLHAILSTYCNKYTF